MIINTNPPEKELRRKDEDKDPQITFKDGTVIVWNRMKKIKKWKLKAAHKALIEGRITTFKPKSLIKSYHLPKVD